MKRAETHQLNKVINLVSPIVRQTNIVCPNAIFWEIYTHTYHHLYNSSIKNINLDMITRERLENYKEISPDS